VQPASAGRRGAVPVLIEAAHEREEAELVAERIVQAQAAGLPWSEMAVLCRTKRLMRPLELALNRRRVPLQSMNATAFRRFDWAWPSVKLLTLHSAKGLEFAQVFLVGLHTLPTPDESLEDAVRLLYVGMTRATQTLVLSAVCPPGQEAPALLQRVRQALSQVATAYAAPEAAG
jgi:superfamily I DNA/RNA helicase